MKTPFTENIKSGLFWIGLFKTAGQVFIWANTIIIARFLVPADYGLVGMTSLITGFIILIGNVGFGSSIIQKKDLQTIHVHSLFCITTGIALGFMLLLYVSAPSIASFFNSPEVCSLLRLSAIALFFSVIADIPNSLLLKNLQYKFVGSLDFASNFLASICVLLLAINGFGAYSLVFGAIITGFLKFSLACVFGRWWPRLQFQKHGLQGFLKFGGAVVVDRILWYLYSNSDYMILAKKLGKVPFGLYSFAFNLACIPTNKLQPIIYPVLFSAFSQIQDDFSQMKEHFLQISKVAFIFYAMIYSGIFWVSPEFVQIFLGNTWEPIIPILQILLIIQPLRSIAGLSPPLLNAIGRPDIGATNMAIFVTIMVPGFYLGSFWGMTGVALMWCLAYPIAYLIILARILRPVNISFRAYFRQLIPGCRLVLLVSLCIFAFKLLVSFLNISSPTLTIWIQFSGTIFIGCLVNASVLWYFDRDLLTSILAFIKK